MKRYSKLFGLSVLLIALASLAISTASAAGPFFLSRASGPTPFSTGCNGAPQTGVNYLNAEVEPWVTVNPRNSDHLIGVWQQDRWSNGGANGLLTGVSRDGGRTWTRTAARFSRCAGGNVANGGDYERASDPWVTFSPNGVAHQIALSFDDSDGNQAVLVSRSTDGGNTWRAPITLARDTDFDIGLDKEAITADSHDARFVYAVWDRLTGLTNPDPNAFTGPVWFSRTTNGGASWEPARIIYDPGPNAQTISNQIVVLPNGDLVNVFVRFLNANDPTPIVDVVIIRSTNKGGSWSQPIVVNSLQSIGVTDPKTDEPVRTGDIIPDIAVDEESGALYIVWQDARFSGGKRDGIVLSKSTNGGLSWSAPVQINKAPKVQAFTGSVDVAEDGVIGVTYYDFRKDTSNPAVLLTNYWLLTSRDGGSTWRETPIAGPFDMRTAPFARGFFVGDYEGLGHVGGSFLPFFVQANSGNTANRTDVFAALGEDNEENGANGREDLNVNPRNWKERINSHRERGSR